MNSEELEQSLRAEFENYLNGVFADMRKDVAEFQSKIDAEFEKHRSQMDEAFSGFSGSFGSEFEFDTAFREAVVEHLRLARDDGAQVTANAMAEAEDLEKAARTDVSLSELKEALNDISSKDSQSSILKSLITHAAKYTPRGAFFIIKNEQLVGWKVFGEEAADGESAIREIHFPVSADTIIGHAVKSQSLSEGSFGTYGDDSSFLDPLQFGRPDRMYAVPLTARGRGVAVLYADYGHSGVTVNTDALEMLVRVAGLTVEKLASAKSTHSVGHTATHDDLSDVTPEVQHSGRIDADDSFGAVHHAPVSDMGYPAESVQTVASETEYAEPSPDFYQSDTVTDHPASTTEVSEHRFEKPPPSDFSFPASLDSAAEYVPESPAEEASGYSTFETAEFERTQPIDYSSLDAGPIDESTLSAELRSYQPAVAVEPESVEVDATPVSEPAIVYDAPQVDGSDRFEASPFDQPAEQFEPSAFIGGPAVTTAPVVEKGSTTAPGTRLSDRNVDLPIEVADDERRLHNDARRFARLLVSEIKLYNEKKVKEGREASDLYERLREAIDRSRDMYNKRVQSPVAAKFDYFHYEIVNSLAEGDEARLGNSYPGTTV